MAVDFVYYAELRRLRLLHKKLDPWGAFLPNLIVLAVNLKRNIKAMEYTMKYIALPFIEKYIGEYEDYT